jgi:xanthine dehydrogenase accessory factor
VPLRVLIRGGGDLSSGVALRLHHIGCELIINELAQPLMVRRLASFGEAVYSGEMTIEGVTARLCVSVDRIQDILKRGEIPVLIDPNTQSRHVLQPDVIIDGRMTKKAPDLGMDSAPMTIGLGPGFTAGENCHVVVETNRGHFMGRIYWSGSAEKDTGVPESVLNQQTERVLRASADGILCNVKQIGALVEKGEVITSIAGAPIVANFSGVLRGIMHDGLQVTKNMKIGDLDPRGDPRYCHLVSDKALAVGGGILEAILTRAEFKAKMCL